MDVTTNKEVVTTFSQHGAATTSHVSGALTVRLTRLNSDLTPTSSTIVRNISGPYSDTKNPDGSTTQIAVGPELWVFDPLPIAPGLPRLTITTGRTVSVFGPAVGQFKFISLAGTFEDVCAALAP
jgi:hypothetical protein